VIRFHLRRSGSNLKEDQMHKLSLGVTLAAVLLFAGLMSLSVGAIALTGVGAIDQGADHSLVEKAACGGAGVFARCPRGQHWQCFGQGNCSCVPCYPIACSRGYCYRCPMGRCGCYRCFHQLACPPGYCYKNVGGRPGCYRC
jgi:hypothetical protein